MIKIENISKKFIKEIKNKEKIEFYADKDITFEAKDGEILGILGPNGAGKTTLLRMISGIMTPSSGTITIDNLNYKDNELEIKKRISFLTGNTKLYKDLSAYELLTMCGEYYGLSTKEINNRIKDLTDRFKMKDFLYQRISSLSTGQTQRVSIARCLVHNPKYYILDEPTTGLHIADVHKLVEILQRLVDTGNSIIVIEHNLDLIKTADYIIDLGPEGGDAGGEIIAVGTPEQICKNDRSYTGKFLKKYLEK